MKKFRLVVPILTPFSRHEINEDSFRKLLRHIFLYLERKDAVFISGFTGEFSKLSIENKKRLIEIAINENPDCRIILGVTNDYESFDDIDAFVALPINYNNNEELLEYYENIISHGPTILYNNPNINKNNIPIRIIEELKNEIIGVKDSSGDLNYLKSLIKICNVYQGDESKIYDALKLGAIGAVPGISNIFPNLPIELIENYKKDLFVAMDMQKKINYIRSFYIMDPINGIKASLELFDIKIENNFSGNKEKLLNALRKINEEK